MHKAVTFLLATIVIFMLAGSSLASVAVNQNPELWLAKPLFGPDTQLPQATSGIPYDRTLQPKTDPLGETFTLGTTWYDYQHNGTIEKMISLTDNLGVHFCWMNGLEINAVNRHVYYNYYNPMTGALSWPGVGYQVDQGYRAGYTTLSHLGAGEAVVAYHQAQVSGDEWHTQTAYDFIEGFGAFQTHDMDNLPDWNETIWPHATVDAQGYIHVMGCENRETNWQRIAYARSEDGGVTYTPWMVVDTLVTISPMCAASPVSNKVGIAYCKSEFDVMNLGPYADLLVAQMNNGITLIESDDGVTWDFSPSARQDITELIAPDASHLPDSAFANGDTLRAYCDVSLLYDQDDYAHVAFTTRGYWFDAGLAEHPDSFAVLGITVDASMIWHWSEEHDSLTIIADGWYLVGDPDAAVNQGRGAGAWRSTCDRPSLGMDPATGYLYCTYVRCPEGDTSGGALASHGFANGEIYCSVSTDGGLNWTAGTNLTQTPSILCTPGNCFDEDYASLAKVVNDTLHLMYVEDKDAGGVVMTAPQEGSWTENPVKYQRVPVDLVPTGPPYVPNYNFHVVPGATGIQEPTLVGGSVPGAYALHQNYPNPFNPETAIRFDVSQAGPVNLRIYNVTGQLVRELSDGYREPGSYEILWNGRGSDDQLMPSGIYFCRMKAEEFVETMKMALIK
jgi:hypothetical protein